MKIYCLVQERDGHMNSRRYFSSKEKAIEWLDKLIMQVYKEYLEQGCVQVYRFALTIDWIYRDEYSIDEVWLDPECPNLNYREDFIPIVG